MKQIRLHILLLISFFTLSSDGFGQWEKVIELPNHFVADVRFFEDNDNIKVGYILFSKEGVESSTIFRSTNGGDQWTPSTPTSLNSQFTSIAIKDSLIAWIFPGYASNDDFAYKTLDGGLNWNPTTLRGLFGGSYYHKKSKLFLINDWGSIADSYLSTDDLNSWSVIENLSTPAFRTGFAFTDENLGICGGGYNLTTSINLKRTTDGGYTWQTLSAIDENYQPLAIKNTTTFFLASEISNNILRSDDAGNTWDTIYHFPNNELVTGCIVGNLCHLYIQTIGGGLFESVDEGKTWYRIADYNGYHDTRFFFFNNILFVGDTPESSLKKPGALWRYELPSQKPHVTFGAISVKSNGCLRVDTIINYYALNSCDGDKVLIDTIYTTGSSAFSIIYDTLVREIISDSLIINYQPKSKSRDTSYVHFRFKLKGNYFDTVMNLYDTYQPPQSAFMPLVSDTALSLMSSTCYGKEEAIYYSLSDSCIGAKGVLVSATVTGSTNFQVTADADSATVIYNGAGYDTAKLALKFRLYEYEYDTVITLYGYPSATKDSLSFLATLTKPSVTWEETTELRISPDKAAANKGLAEIRFDLTLDADVLEPLTNYSTGIGGASIVMGSATPVGKLSRYGFVITGTNMTLDPAVSILNLPMRPYVSDTTMTTINVSTTKLNPQDPDYERCTLSATGGGVPFTLELMCGDSLLSRYLGGKPILTITSLKPNPTKSDVTVTFDLVKSGTVKAEVLDVLGNLVKAETLEASQGETKYNISLPDAAEGVYYVRLRYGSETRTGKLVRE